MGDPSVEVSEADREGALVQKAMAMDAAFLEDFVSSKKFLFSASMFVKLKKPNVAIRDADTVLKINDELGKGYKARVMAKGMLGLWEDAARDLHIDGEATVMLKKVESVALRLQKTAKNTKSFTKQGTEKGLKG